LAALPAVVTGFLWFFVCYDHLLPNPYLLTTHDHLSISFDAL